MTVSCAAILTVTLSGIANQLHALLNSIYDIAVQHVHIIYVSVSFTAFSYIM